jgi:hypothetical protein
VDGVDRVGSGTLTGSTCIGDSGRTAGVDAGAGAGAGADTGVGAGAGLSAGAGARGVKEKFEGPGL